jgi:hypothetical protein
MEVQHRNERIAARWESPSPFSDVRRSQDAEKF